MNPRFSIVTITYNAEPVLEVTIQSVLAQTYDAIEYIIVDGNSTDKTLAVIDKYKTRINKVISEPDRGIYDAMNKGIKEATGDYLIFLNAGDTFKESETLSRVVKSISDSDKYKQTFNLPDIIYGETAIVDKERRFLHMRRLSAPDRLDWKSFKKGMLVCHQSFWVRRELIEPYNLTYRFSSDFEWSIRMLKKANSVYNTHLILINYLKEGTTTQNHKTSLKERFLIMGKYYGWTSTILNHLWFVIRLFIKP